MIYFVQAGDTEHVKIGWTTSESTLKSRLAALQNGQPHRLSVLRTIDADRWVENWFHTTFADRRLVGEWFIHHPDMLTLEPPSARAGDRGKVALFQRAIDLMFMPITLEELAAKMDMSLDSLTKCYYDGDDPKCPVLPTDWPEFLIAVAEDQITFLSESIEAFRECLTKEQQLRELREQGQ